MDRNDRELLELAAKAAGYAEIDFLSYADDGLANVYDAGGRQSAWNPLTNDGDALRLAVKLRMVVEVDTAWSYAWYDYRKQHTQESHVAQAPVRATRRAVTRAAAEIGKSMG